MIDSVVGNRVATIIFPTLLFLWLLYCICLSFPWGWGLDVDLILSVPGFSYLLYGIWRKKLKTVCLAVDLITVNHFAYLFNCIPVHWLTLFNGPDLKAIHYILWVGPFYVSQLEVFVCFSISVVSLTPRGSSGISTRCFS